MKHRRLFIPNRGEIVKRIVQSARRLGFAVFGMVPRGDLGLDYKQVLDGFVEFDEQEHNYFLDTSFIINLCKFFNCNFLHPGYGFLSESPKLSKACQENGIVFIGPSDTHLELCGNKEACKNSVKGFFNLIPSASLSDDLKSLEKWVQLHSPIIVKAQWGGGGRGMRKVYSPNELQIYLEQASKEAANFGVPAVFVEKLIEKARHVEFQVVKPKVKDAIILGTRDCTIQRRFQKIIEEAPAFIEERLVLETSERIKNYFNSIDFFGVATVEFLYEGDQLYFLEINPRLQVEHTVTEEIFNVDIVNLQFLIAMNESFNVDPKCVGHSIQLRINAEKGLDLLPAQGIFESLKYPASRVEATYSQGTVVNSHFDSLVAKLIVSAKDRRECLKKAIRALMDLEIRGVETNQALLLLILTTHDFISNSHHTDWLESKLKEWKDDNRFNLLNKALSDSLSSDQGGGVFKGCFRFKKENDFLKIDLNLA